MLECGFCGANLSRRRWHSSSKYTKTIWQCVESTKHGKRFCPDSKGIPEQVIEDAFIESYRMLCTDHKDVLEEFIKRVEKTLSEDSIEDKIEKLNRSVYNIQYKRKKLLENYLEGVVAKDIYEETDVGYEKKLSEAKTQLSMLEQQYDNEGSLQRRLADFRKALSKNQILEEFDRGIFESIIEKVIVGGYDENGEKDPYKIIFIYKTGFKNEIGNAKERFGKKSKAVETVKEMCSHIVDEVKDVCSYVSDNTCRSRVLSTSGEFVEVLNFREDNEESSEETTGCKASVYAEFDECTRSENFIEILRFRHFTRYMSFTPTGKQGKKNRKDACFQNFWKMSVLFFYSKAKEKIKNGNEERNMFIRESRAGCRYCTDEIGRVA